MASPRLAKATPNNCAGYSFAALVIMVAFLPGCAAVMAAKQPGKKDLSLLSEGMPRTHLIAELGAPTWTEERDGQVTDVFAFKQGYRKPVKASRALFHGAADVFTGGLWEVVAIPAETLADGSDVKVEVKYDPQRKVALVTVLEGEEVVHPRPLLGRWRNKRTNTSPAPVVGAQQHGMSIAKNVIGIPDEPESIHGDQLSVSKDQLR